MIVNKKAVAKEALKRKASLNNKVELVGNFPEQDALINDPSRFIAAQCSRRAGKTNGLALKYFKSMETHPKAQFLYLALTRDSAKEILWGVLQDFNDQYQLGCTFTESNLTVKHPNGSSLKLFGADAKNLLRRLKGRKYPGVGIDEAQDFGEHLQSLIDDVITPSMADYADSWLVLTGTPGPVPQGYFFEVTRNKRFGYSHHGWTILQNPHMPNAQAYLNEVLAKREWTHETPSFRREYLNEWVLDVESLWIKYTQSVNDFTVLPKEHKWNYVLGVDIGFNDADAIAVIAWSETSPVTYLVEERIERKQGISALVSQIDELQKKYDAYKIVMDEGALGKKIGEDLRQRFGCPIVAADKAHKQDNVELLNDAMRLGKFKAKHDSQFAKDSYKVQIDWDKSTPKKIIIKKKPHSDIIDSVLYGFRESYAYTHTTPVKAPQRGTKEWADQQSSSMFDAELQGLTQQHEDADDIKRKLGIFE